MIDVIDGQTSLVTLTWTEYAEAARRGALVILPVGSIEQHGPHLPISTDSVLSVELSRLVASAGGGYVAAPLLYGCRSDLFSGGGEAFPGTQSLRHETFGGLAVDVMSELVADGFRRLLVLNAHYENTPILREALRRITAGAREAQVLLCNWWDVPPRASVVALFPGEFPGMDLEHAGLLETSLMLHLAPHLVRPRETFPDTLVSPPGYEVFPESLQRGAAGNGALAPATAATAEIGARLARLVIDGILNAVTAHLPEGNAR